MAASSRKHHLMLKDGDAPTVAKTHRTPMVYYRSQTLRGDVRLGKLS
jgi:hypothetical protein